MKLYQVSFDATTITVVAEDLENLFIVLHSRDEQFELKDDKIFYRWDYAVVDECDVIEVSMKIPLVVQWESH